MSGKLCESCSNNGCLEKSGTKFSVTEKHHKDAYMTESGMTDFLVDRSWIGDLHLLNTARRKKTFLDKER